jgi:hypothetical protein
MKPIYLLFLGGLFLISACKKEKPCNHPNEHIKIDSTEEKKVPYTGTDTLRLYYHDSTTTDTITYIGQGRIYDEMNLEDRGTPACEWEVWGERYTVLYKTDKPGMDLQFRVIAQTGGNTFEIRLQNQTLEDLFWVVNNSQYLGYFHEKEVNGKLYYRVNGFFDRGTSKSFNVYYTTDSGIIRMELFNDKVWELIDNK